MQMKSSKCRQNLDANIHCLSPRNHTAKRKKSNCIFIKIMKQRKSKKCKTKLSAMKKLSIVQSLELQLVGLEKFNSFNHVEQRILYYMSPSKLHIERAYRIPKFITREFILRLRVSKANEKFYSFWRERMDTLQRNIY